MQAEQSKLRAGIVELRTVFLHLMEITLANCSTACTRERPHARFDFKVICINMACLPVA